VTTASGVAVYLDVPARLRPRAAWVLDALLGACGARARVVRQPGRAASCALAYAAAPIPGVPTIPVSPTASDLLLAGRPLPAGSFRRLAYGRFRLWAAFPTGDEAEGGPFAVPFDLVASAFVLLSAWDEHTITRRDQYGRLPYAASVFARNPGLSPADAPVDAYVKLLRELLERRLPEIGAPPLPDPDWRGGRFALALTHDIERVRPRASRHLVDGARRSVRGAVNGDRPQLRAGLGDLRRTLMPSGGDRENPCWPFPALPARERSLGTGSTYFIMASHRHRSDGADARAYARRRSTLVRLLRGYGREVGILGNERHGRDLAGLLADRATLATAAEAPVEGIRLCRLRCLYHETLPLLDAAGLVYDSSLAFPEHLGFRCGCSFPFHPYDIAHERPLGLVELPLAVAEATLQEQTRPSAEAAAAAALGVLERVRLSGGAAAVLWRQERFDDRAGSGYGEVYWRIVHWALEQGGFAGSAAEVVRCWTSRGGSGRPGAVSRSDHHTSESEADRA
jgi:hypothetical protein